MRLFSLLLLIVTAATAQQSREPARQATAAASDQKAVPSEQPGATQQKPKSPEPELVPPPPSLPLNTGSYVEQPLPILIAPPPPLPPPIKPSVQPLNLQSAGEIIKVVLGLVFMFALAYLAGTSKVQALESKLQVTNVVAAGLPFVFLGVVAHMRVVGIL